MAQVDCTVEQGLCSGDNFLIQNLTLIWFKVSNYLYYDTIYKYFQILHAVHLDYLGKIPKKLQVSIRIKNVFYPSIIKEKKFKNVLHLINRTNSGAQQKWTLMGHIKMIPWSGEYVMKGAQKQVIWNNFGFHIWWTPLF